MYVTAFVCMYIQQLYSCRYSYSSLSERNFNYTPFLHSALHSVVPLLSNLCVILTATVKFLVCSFFSASPFLACGARKEAAANVAEFHVIA